MDSCKLPICLILIFLFCNGIHLHSQQAIPITDFISPGNASTFGQELEGIVAKSDNSLLFTIRTTASRWQLWHTNGTEAGTYLLQEFDANTTFNHFVPYNNGFAFIVNLKEVWFTNKTPGGTYEIAKSEDFLLKMVLFEGRLHISTSEEEILIYNPEQGALTPLITSFSNNYSILDMIVLGDQLITLAGNQQGRGIFTSNGNPEHAEFIHLINSGNELFQSTLMTIVDDKVFFFYKFSGNPGNYFLYVTDGTPEGSKQLNEFEFNSLNTNFLRRRATLGWQGKFYFNAQILGTSSGNDALFVSDGTLEGLQQLDPNPSINLRPSYLTPYNDRLYFRGDFCCYTFGIYSTDGTLDDTSLDISGEGLGGGVGFGGEDIVVFDGLMYFAAFRNETGYELWRSDGYSSGTEVIDIVPGTGGSFPSAITLLNDKLIFEANSPSTGRELFVLGECTEGNLTELTTGICPGETFTFGDNQISSPGSYQASFTNQQGCDSLVFLEVEPLESPSVQLGPDTTISQNEVLDLSIFGSYFGIFWNDGTVGNEYIFSAETPGQYTISVTVYGFNGCPATDEIIINVEMVSSSATFTEAKPIQCRLFPNPASFGQSIQLLLENIPDRLQQIELIIYDTTGRKRVEKQHHSKSSISIDYSFEAGLYFVQLWSAGQMLSSQSFIVQ